MGECSVSGACLLLGGAFPRRRAWWGPEGPRELGWVCRKPEAWNVPCTLTHHRVLSSHSRDCERQFVISRFIRQVHPRPSICNFSFSLAARRSHCGQPWVWRMECMRCIPFQDSATGVPATVPSKKCCLLTLHHSGDRHSREACQNTGQINMSLDYPPHGCQKIHTTDKSINQSVTSPPFFYPLLFLSLVTRY